MAIVKIDWRRRAVQSRTGEIRFQRHGERCFRAVCRMRFGAVVPHEELRQIFGSEDRRENHVRNCVSYLRRRLALIGVRVLLDKSGRYKDDGGYFLDVAG